MGLCTSKINPSCDSPSAGSGLGSPSKQHFSFHPVPSTQRKCSDYSESRRSAGREVWRGLGRFLGDPEGGPAAR
eukprot:523487-Pyramimonas_sp.AAC.1